MITNHYGHTVDSNIPVTGVLSIHDLNWEVYDYNNEICLTCESWGEEIDNNLDDEVEKEIAYDGMECDGSHTKIIGDWIKDEKGLYEPDKENGEYSAIVNESTIQVVWSKFTTRGRLCSPCYPGQLDVRIDNPTGNYVGYTLPNDLIYHPD